MTAAKPSARNGSDPRAGNKVGVGNELLTSKGLVERRGRSKRVMKK